MRYLERIRHHKICIYVLDLQQIMSHILLFSLMHAPYNESTSEQSADQEILCVCHRRKDLFVSAPLTPKSLIFKARYKNHLAWTSCTYSYHSLLQENAAYFPARKRFAWMRRWSWRNIGLQYNSTLLLLHQDYVWVQMCPNTK